MRTTSPFQENTEQNEDAILINHSNKIREPTQNQPEIYTDDSKIYNAKQLKKTKAQL